MCLRQAKNAGKRRKNSLKHPRQAYLRRPEHADGRLNGGLDETEVHGRFVSVLVQFRNITRSLEHSHFSHGRIAGIHHQDILSLAPRTKFLVFNSPLPG